MIRFAIQEIFEVKGTQKFYQLVILNKSGGSADKLNNAGVWNNYEEALEQKYGGSFRALLAIMDRKSNLLSLKESQFRDITPAKELVKEFEFKYQDLRCYGIKLTNGVLIIHAGFKNQQKTDIIKFRSLKKEYLNSERK